MSTQPFLLAGRICLTFAALVAGPGSFLADFNKTHVYNPKWPPHARFHNGQTMTLGAICTLATLFFTYRYSPPSTSSFSPVANAVATAQYKDSMFTAAIFGSIYYIAGLSAILYPGTKWVDPEFDPTGKAGPQPRAFTACAVLAWVGWWLGTYGL